MANIAPRIKWHGDKFNHKGAYSKENTKGYYFYQTPSVLTNFIMNYINGNCGNQLKLMWVLMGSAENFGISEKTIIQRTGMTQQAYCNARKALNEAGIINYNPSEHTITIDYNYLWHMAEQYYKDNVDDKNVMTSDEFYENWKHEDIMNKTNKKWDWE